MLQAHNPTIEPSRDRITRDLFIPARDAYPLAATAYGDNSSQIAVISSATAVPRAFYANFATALAARGYQVVTYDYRGIGGSRPPSLRGFTARARDWALKDMQGVVDWARGQSPRRLVLVGHSMGGQVAGLLEDASNIDAMVTFSSQSGHWRLQGGAQKASVAFHVHVTIPVLSSVFGYMPWSRLGSAEDLPMGVALEWAHWCRQRDYLLGETSLPLARYDQFRAPVLAYSFDDDPWGTARSVDAMMRAYPHLERRHVRVADTDLSRIGHFGFFRSRARALWQDAFDWLDRC